MWISVLSRLASKKLNCVRYRRVFAVGSESVLK